VPKLPANVHELRAAQKGPQAKRKFIEDERMMRVMSAAYYGAIAHIDDQVGKLLNELERLGMADNTQVLFTADHGNMLGDHGRWFKGVMYEGSSHVPLIWRGPKGASENNGRVETKIVENIDLLPTIMDSVGLPVPDRVQGRSFLKLARGKDALWKDLCFSQLATGMIRTPEWKLIDNSHNLSGTFEMYDMRNDPKEQRNLIDEPKLRDQVVEFRRQLTAWRADRPVPVKIAGMKEPEYTHVSDAERKEIIENSPAAREN
jgi:arylsulfatase A-like enzyme